MYNDLSEYTGQSIDKLQEMCKAAAYGLLWEWAKKDNVLDFYRETELYIYDLTHYQHDILGEEFYNWFNAMTVQIKGHGLDLGGGIGEYTIQAIKQGATMDFIDVDGFTLKYAKWRFKKHNVEPNIFTEDFKIDKDYDFIVAMDVLEHLENPEERIKEFHKHTKYLFANPEQVQYNIKYPQHISRYDLTPYYSNLSGNLWVRK